MANVPKALYRATITDVAAKTVTVSNGKRWAVTNVILANTGAAAVKATVELDGVALVPAVLLAVGALFTLDCAQVIEAGKVIRVTISAAGSVGVHISGVEADI